MRWKPIHCIGEYDLYEYDFIILRNSSTGLIKVTGQKDFTTDGYTHWAPIMDYWDTEIIAPLRKKGEPIGNYGNYCGGNNTKYRIVDLEKDVIITKLKDEITELQKENKKYRDLIFSLNARESKLKKEVETIREVNDILAAGASNDRIPDVINALVETCFGASKAAGWHDTPREDGTFIALIHSELSEALEGLRKGIKDDHLPSRDTAEVELADAIIRICDFAGYKGYDLGAAIMEKLEYNSKRADHKPENRAKDGGKKF